MERSQIKATVDFAKTGKQHGHLCVPYSYNLGGWANLLMPITVIASPGGNGPTALVLAGNHGDEFPGQVAIRKLMQSVTPEQVPGRLILIPHLNLPAVHSSTRLSPLDGKNMNRVFPGKADGTVTEMIAHYLTTVLFPLADIVIDIHTGGRSMDFFPCATMHLVDDKEQRRRMVAGSLAWNTEVAFLYADIAGTGLLPVEAERQGKVVITTEMGGGEIVTAATHRLCQEGLGNVLVQQGVIAGTTVTRESLGLKPTRWVQALSGDDYRFAPESGIFEATVDLGAEVKAGASVGLIHSMEDPQRTPIVIQSVSAGMLLCTRGPSRVAQGDCVACIAHDVDLGVLR